MGSILKIIGALAGAGLVVSLMIGIVVNKNKNVVKQKSRGDHSPNSSVINNNNTANGKQSKSD